MKSLVIYYSYHGATRFRAQALAAEISADLVEVRDAHRPGMVGAFLRCPSALGMKRTPIEPLTVDLSAYAHITIMAPVWAGYPAPAINHVLEALPSGAAVSVKLVSASGKSGCREKVAAKIEAMGCKLEGWEDIASK